MIGTIPNILTVTRILLLPFFVAAFMYNRYNLALYIFILAGITDFFDGLIARRHKQVTALGKLLDPIADKFFMVTSFLLMTYYGLIPKWITIVVISRDMIVITGCLITYLIANHLKIEPTFIGKSASAFQFILIGLVLLMVTLKGSFTVPVFLLLFIAALTVVSGLQYIHKGLKLVNNNTEAGR